MIEENSEDRCNELLKRIEEDILKANNIKKEISKLKNETNQNEFIEIKKQSIKENIEVEEEEEDEFEEEVSFFLERIRNLSDNFEENEMLSVLPSRKHIDYEKIILRLQLESIKEIKEINDLLIEEEINETDLNDYKLLIDKEKRKIEILKKISREEEIVEEEEIKNKLVLVPTISGNIRITDELEHIPTEYYSGFLELIKSIEDGTFKNVKALKKNPRIQGLYEVKLFKIRVVFTRISSDTYALITAFMKKSDNDKLYNESLNSKANDYHLIENTLKKLILDEEFMKENNKELDYIINLLSRKEGNKEYIKEDNHE